MKGNSLICTLLLLLAVVVQLPAQQSEADRKLVDEVKANAEKGDANAEYILGLRYGNGEGVIRNDKEAVKWFRRAVEQNHAGAQYALGIMYYNGLGISKDYNEASKLYRMAAEQGNAEAQTNLGVMYEKGEGVQRDTAEAVKWFRKSAEQGNPIGQNNLGSQYYVGEGVSKDVGEAVKWFRKSAGQGHARAQNTLGGLYAIGGGVPVDVGEAVSWYRKAAEQGYSDAQYNLAGMYYKGEGVDRNFVEAYKWISLSADQGNETAAKTSQQMESKLTAKELVKTEFNLGLMYCAEGGSQNYTKAIKWYRRAADHGLAGAQYNIGVMFYRGQGVTKNYAEAIKFYKMAADQEYPQAQHEIGMCYYKGEGVNQDISESASWFSKAANQGYAKSQNNLGAMTYLGQGVQVNKVDAYKWLRLAANGGDSNSVSYLSIMTSDMTTDQIAEAQRLAREFKPRKGLTAGSFDPQQEISDVRPSASGTGFFITEDGFLITNEHVVKEAKQARLITSAGTISAKVVKIDAANDVALLKAEGKFSPLPIAASRAVRLGNSVVTVGFPNIGLQGFAPKFARGEIAALSGAGDDARYFQISVPVQPGNSGGALVDERGNVVGVVSAKLNARAAFLSSGALPENVNYAVKSSFLLSFLESVPEVSAKLKEPNTKERKFDDVVSDAEKAAVLVVVY